MFLQNIDFDGEINPEDKMRYHKIHIEGAKNNQTYDIWIESECIDAVKRYLEFREKPKDGFILNNYGKKLHHKDALFLNGYGRRLTSQAMRFMVKRYASLCGIKKNVYNHLWRATFVTLADSNNVSLGEIMKRTGHTNPESIKPYLNTKINDSNKSIGKMFISKEPKPQEKPKSIPKTIEKSKDKSKPTDTYIAKPEKESSNYSIQDNNLKELELKLIEQLANGEISNKIYNDAINRLQSLNKDKDFDNVIYG